MADKFIAVSGNIGVGKSTLVEHLHRQYGFQPFYEPFEANPYLDDFYADMSQWAFHSQTWFLSHKFRLHCELGRANGTLVQDRTIYEDAEIFATHLAKTGQMNARDYATYLDLYQAMHASLQPPDLMIYLRCSVRSIRQRVKRRGRANEQAIPLTYLRSLNKLYDSWIARYDLSPVLIWDSDRSDYLTDLVHRAEFHEAIERFV